uniref:Uncharacterized protein n=1 Tax=Chromera velia CCMP2878 TaxID=1169474 RepID=A0A0G4HVH2_9ALVE|eukprot:Cvel_8826.t1-p1 / transcript=Cvel_8826.t1 / gene=Cvel_8826 / organism=Chromera_velia_CCMP2878 / gene_product=hypothetical protein / transcript_product=hypothetical protein / location=Cvel_scaffold495:9287-10436(+) / protein_length=288 / sequence_SO=supercontig / SO=protein_coding / is_pseudo=false
MKDCILRATGETETVRLVSQVRALLGMKSTDYKDAEDYEAGVIEICNALAELMVEEEVVAKYVGPPGGDRDPVGSISGIEHEDMRANVRSQLPASLPFYGEKRACEQMKNFRKPAAFRPKGKSPSHHQLPDSMATAAGRISGGAPRHPAPSRSQPQQQQPPRHSGQPPKTPPPCDHSNHRANKCLRKLYCRDCSQFGHQTGDCALAKAEGAGGLLRKYKWGKFRNEGGAALTGSPDDHSDGSSPGPAAQTVGALTSVSSSPPVSEGFSFVLGFFLMWGRVAPHARGGG